MASFSDSNFTKKLSDLNPSQQSIQTLSLWLIHHRKHARNIVRLWLKEVKRVKPNRRLTLMYLANDVIQNSKKKGPEFNKEYKVVLLDAFRATSKDADEKTKGSMARLCNIWKERGVYDADTTIVLTKALELDDAALAAALPSKSSKGKGPVKKSKPAAKPLKRKEEGGAKPEKPEPKPDPSWVLDSTTKTEEKKEAPTPPPKKKKRVELSLKDEIEAEFANGPGEPPEPEKLVASLQELENSASSDAAVRERIAALPPEVSDVSLLPRITDKQQAAELTRTVEEACALLKTYNERLASELAERKIVARMLRDFISAQKTALQDAEIKLQEHKNKLQQVDVVRKELKSHIQSLPDMSLLPDVTGGLMPLPSAGDLFNIDKALGID